MTKGGEELVQEVLEHYGTKGMKWGVRNVKVARGMVVRSAQKRRAETQKFQLASKLTAGEAAASFLVGGPFGLIGYKLIKRHAAVKKRENANLSAEQQIAAAGRIRVGEALAVGIVSSPLGLVTYAAAKQAAAHTVDEF